MYSRTGSMMKTLANTMSRAKEMTWSSICKAANMEGTSANMIFVYDSVIYCRPWIWRNCIWRVVISLSILLMDLIRLTQGDWDFYCKHALVPRMTEDALRYVFVSFSLRFEWCQVLSPRSLALQRSKQDHKHRYGRAGLHWAVRSKSTAPFWSGRRIFWQQRLQALAEGKHKGTGLLAWCPAIRRESCPIVLCWLGKQWPVWHILQQVTAHSTHLHAIQMLWRGSILPSFNPDKSS